MDAWENLPEEQNNECEFCGEICEKQYCNKECQRAYIADNTDRTDD